MWRKNLTTQYYSLSNYSSSNLSIRITELNQRKRLIYKLRRKIKNKIIQLNQQRKQISWISLDIIHDKLSVVGKIYFQLLVSKVWTTTAPWLVEQVESSSILYENCQRMCIETVYTRKHRNTHIQLKIIMLDPDRTAKKTQHFSIEKINWLILFKETMAVFTENHTKPVNTKLKCTVC
jgi:hypothetical protein